MASILLAALVSGAMALRAQAPAVRDARSPNPAAATATIRGRVIVADGDLPIRKARITLTADTGPSPDPVYSDADGRFELRGVSPGRYIVAAWKAGYVETKFGARDFWDRHVRVVALAGAVVGNLQIALPKGAAIWGRVLDESGEPLPNMTVSAGRVVVANGRTRFENVFGAETDDLGEYRIGGLPAGTFAVGASGWTAPVSVEVRPDTSPLPGRVQLVRRPMGTHIVFYPQTQMLTQARPIVLRSGEEAGGIDVTITDDTLRMPIVSGRIIDPQGTSGMFTLSTGFDGGGVPGAGGGMMMGVAPSGEFALALEPGEHALVASSPGGIAIQHVSVGQADVTGLQLLLSKRARIAGRIVWQGMSAHPAGGLSVIAASPDLSLGIARVEPVRVGPNGSFTLSDVIGARELRVIGLPVGWTVKSITAGGRSIMDSIVDFKGGEDLRDVLIVLTDGAAELSGTVTDAHDAPVSAVSVLVFSDDRHLVPRRRWWVRPDTLGRFVVSDVPAGEYLVALVEAVDDTQWSAPEYLERFRSQATHVTLPDGGTHTVALQWPGAR